METLSVPTRTTTGPTWEVAHLYPHQGDWSEEEYLQLTDHTNKLIEFTDGRIEFLPMPTPAHQHILLFLIEALREFVKPRGLGQVLFAGLRVRLGEGMFREPDIVFLSAEHNRNAGTRYWESADLVMEVVSEDDPQRDRVQKRRDYAKAGIPEYWIVDPLEDRVTVLKLNRDRYEEHGEYGPNQQAKSVVLPGFEVHVESVFAAGREGA